MEMLQKIPPYVIYIGLGAFILSPIVAGIQNKSKAVTFILFLRLAIGWHFLFEGLHKVHSEYVGPTETNKPFSATAYFENGEGPLAPAMRSFAGDPDRKLIERMTVPEGKTVPKEFLEAWKAYADKANQVALLPSAKDEDKSKKKDEQAKLAEMHAKLPEADDGWFPAALVADWNDYIARFQEKYGKDEPTKKSIADKVKDFKAAMAAWIANPRDVKKEGPGGTGAADVSETVSQTIAGYQTKLAAYRATLKPSSEIGPIVDKDNITAKQAEIRKARAELRKEVDDKTKKLKDDLADVVKKDLSDPREATLADPTVPMDPVTFLTKWDSKLNLPKLNWMTRWGLTVMGACLMIGLFTRLAAIGAAGFLLMTYLVETPLPWLPVSPMSESKNYLFVNKNLVEMLALMVIATLPTGKWMGLDAMLGKMFGRKRKGK